MKYTTLYRGNELSFNELYNDVAVCFPDKLPDDELNNILLEIIAQVEIRLPDEVMWIPHTSEIVGPADSDFTLEQFRDVLLDAMEKVIG